MGAVPARQRGKGKRALAVELRKKGVDNDVIDAALADLDPAAERQRAEQLVRDKLRRERLDDDDGDVKVTRRLVGMLARRGYNQSMAFDVVSSRAGRRTRAPPGVISLFGRWRQRSRPTRSWRVRRRRRPWRAFAVNARTSFWP